jgi:iron complex outermembrane receptor protein
MNTKIDRFLPIPLLSRALILGAALALTASMPAQTAAPASPPPADTPAMTPTTTTTTTTTTDSSTGPVTTLEKFTVSDVPIDEQVLPTVRPVSSVYGDGMSILDIPRSVSSVNQAWMQERGVKDSLDLGQFSAGVYEAANYGVPSVPQIRGDLAQVYVNGQLTPFTYTNVLPTFNGVESMDIVKGPGSAVYGPQGNGPGGYVNFNTKQPYFDQVHSDISFTMAGWADGHSYSNPSYTIDMGGPITKKLAYRVSYHASYGDNYYLNTKNDDQDIFLALTYLFSNSTKVELWAQYYNMRFNEIAGVNRPTQEFVWNGTYEGGPATSLYDYAGIFSLVAPTGPVKLGQDVTIEGTEDTNRAARFQAQSVVTTDLTSDSQLINRTYFQVSNSKQFEGFGYDEVMPLSQALQDRLEFHKTFDLGGMQNQLIAGGDFRYSRLVSYNDFSLQPFFYFDLSNPKSGTLIPGYSTYLNDTIGSGYAVPGYPGYSGQTSGSSGDQDSHIYDTAGFIQDDIQLTKSFSALLGFREDNIKADTQSPPFLQVVDDNTQPSVYQPEGEFYSTSGTELDPSYFASLVYKVNDSTSFYLTYDRVDAILGSGNFGGVNVAAGSDLLGQLSTSLKTASTLYEAGFKQSLEGNKLYYSVTAYQQIKMSPQITGPAFLVKTNGVEAEVVYQPSKQWTFNANATYQESTDFGSYFYQQTGNFLDGFPAGYPVGAGEVGTGLGSPNFTGYEPPSGSMRAPGVPQILGNAFAEYKDPSGWGIGAGPRYYGRQYANDQDTLHIPSAYELDGFVYYKWKRWDVHVNFNNITNQRILNTIDVGFAGNDLIFVDEPANASITFHYHY